MPLSRVRSYLRSGVVSPSRGPDGAYRFSFQDILILRTAEQLRASDVPVRRVSSALRNLRAQLPDGRPLTAVHVSADGGDVVVRDDDSVWRPASGQFQLDLGEFAAARAGPRVPHDSPVRLERRATRVEPTGVPRPVTDPFELGVDLETIDPAAAETAYRRALALDPANADAHVNLGRLLHESGRTVEAERHYRLALEAEPENAVAAFNLGVALEDLGRRLEATEEYERAVAADPGHADAHFNLSRLYERAGDKAAALRHLLEYKKLLVP